MIERRFGILWRRLEVRLDTIPLVLMAIFHIHNLSMDDVVPLPPNIDPNEAPLTGTAPTCHLQKRCRVPCANTCAGPMIRQW